MSRCNFPNCKRKLSITVLACQCNLKFCKKHSFPEVHSCSWIKTYKKEQKELIRKLNPVVKADKLVKV